MSKKTPAGLFPTFETEALDGTAYTIPADFRNPLNLVLLWFTESRPEIVDHWVMLVDRIDDGAEHELSVYELPVVGKGFGILGGLFNAGMRVQNDDPEVQARTLPLYVDKGGLARQLGIKKKSELHAFLVAPDGRIAWRGAGEIDLAEVAGIEKLVGATLSDRPAGAGPPQPAAPDEEEATDGDEADDTLA